MIRYILTSLLCGVFCALLVGSPNDAASIQNDGPAKKAKFDSKTPAYGILQRIPWTSSRVKGSPESPLPFRSDRVFDKLQFDHPVLITMAPGMNRFFVGELRGKIYSFPNDPKCDAMKLFIDLTKLPAIQPLITFAEFNHLYGLTFHPNFEENRRCYICYTLRSKKRGENLEYGTRVSEFKVKGVNPPVVDPSSEKLILTWLEGGHNGGCLKFGPDGNLYISTGDATPPSPPDGLDTGQGVDDLLSCILRIDVDHPDEGKNYGIPKDNPFVNIPNAKPEIWAYGFRNPWRMSFDKEAGELWVGDVGWERWELVHRVKRGGNYGWSVMEGEQPVRPSAKKGPTPISLPAIAFPHTEAASITGGFVYHGKKLPKLKGKYICADWETKKFWASEFNKEKVLDTKLIAETTQRVVAFGVDHDGELYYVDHDPEGGIYQLVRNIEQDTSKDFPRKISQTGLFANVAQQQPSAGVIPFSINAEQWIDYGKAQRFAAFPGKSGLNIHEQRQAIPKSMFRTRFFFPENAVLVKTISLQMEQGNPSTAKNVETQLLHYDGRNWHPYTYEWNEAGTDAHLVESSGKSKTIKVRDKNAPGGVRYQKWHFLGRGQCLQCHNPWAGFNLAFTLPQMDRDHLYGNVLADQLETLEHIGMIKHAAKLELDSKKSTKRWEKYWQPLVNPFDAAVDIHQRARAYLHVNCSHCHQNGAGGTTTIDLRHSLSLKQMKVFDAPPVQGEFGLAGPSIVRPGAPFHSILYYRMATLGNGRMPHVGSTRLDKRGLQLIHDWIRLLPNAVNEEKIIEELAEFDENRFLAAQQKRKNGFIQQRAAMIAKAHKHKTITASDRIEAAAAWKKEFAKQKKIFEDNRKASFLGLLKDSENALLLVQVLETGRLPESVSDSLVKTAQLHASPDIRDLLERFIPDDQKIQRLGTNFQAADILNLAGNAISGREYFFNNKTNQCLTCHKVGNEGQEVGPDLTKIGGKYKRTQILDKLMFPSKEVDPKYQTQTVVTLDGKLHSGILAEKNGKEVVLRDAKNTITRFPANHVQEIIPQKRSLMPDGLLQSMTAQEAADLLAYLESLK